MYEGNDGNRGTQGVELIRIRPHDRELDERRRRMEGRGSSRGQQKRNSRQRNQAERIGMEKARGERGRMESGDERSVRR